MNILLTAGPTQEAIDPVRYITNRSSGRMGFSIAQAAAEAGHKVQLIAGPVHLETPPKVERTNVTSSQEMLEAVASRIHSVDIAIMTAAVSDYRPVHPATEKIKKSSDRLTLELEKNPDILGSLRDPMGFKGLVVGFAAETNNLHEFARGKLERKRCDLLVANDVSRKDIGFDSRENEVILFFKNGDVLPMEKVSKHALAEKLIGIIEQLFSNTIDRK